MSERITRTIHIALPGGRTSPDSIAHIINTVFSEGLGNGERVESIVGKFGDMAETLTIDVVVSAPPEYENPQMTIRDIVEDERR